MQPPLFWKAQVSSLLKQRGVTEFSQQTGLSQSLMFPEGNPNLNATLKGSPQKFWSLFGQKAHKTTQITQLYPKRGCLSLSDKDQGQTYNPECNPKRLHNKYLVFNWDGSTHSTQKHSKFCDWSVSNQEQISLVETFLLITRLISTLSK